MYHLTLPPGNEVSPSLSYSPLSRSQLANNSEAGWNSTLLSKAVFLSTRLQHRTKGLAPKQPNSKSLSFSTGQGSKGRGFSEDLDL